MRMLPSRPSMRAARCRCWSAAPCCTCARCARSGAAAAGIARSARARSMRWRPRAGWAALHAELARVDPEAAARIAPQRCPAHPARAGSLPTHRRADLAVAARDARARATRSPLAALCALAASRASSCGSGCSARFHAMLRAGFVDEVRALYAARRSDRAAFVDARGRLPAALALLRRRS